MVEVLISVTPATPGGTTGHWFRDMFDESSELYEDFS